MQPDEEWARAKRLCRLSNEDVRMARELGFKAKSLIKNIPNPKQQWKAPVAVWVRDLYERKFGKPAPARSEDAPPRPSHIHSLPEPALDWEFEDIFDDSTPPTRDEIVEEKELMLGRQRQFRLAAEYVAKALAGFDAVQRIVLFGSVVRPLKMEVPRFKKFRRAGQSIPHECKDVDIAVWLSDLSILKPLQRARSQALNTLLAERDIGVAHHQVDVFVIEPGTNRYLGRLCSFGVCPKGKRECLVENCGAIPFLQQHEDFVFDAKALSDPACVMLFDRGSTAR